MANFFNLHTRAQYDTLMVVRGQSVDVGLWGGGPNGEDLVIVSTDENVVEIFKKGGRSGLQQEVVFSGDPHVRRFTLTGKGQPGQWTTVKATLGDGGPAWATMKVELVGGDAKKGWVRVNLHGVEPIGQSLSTLCWLACYRMLYVWKGLDPSTIEDDLTAAGIDVAAARMGGLPPQDMAKAARALGLTPVGFGQSITGRDLQRYLYFGPVWIAGQWAKFGLHARLIIGASDDSVEYFDPWYGGSYGYDLDHKELLSTFVHGNGRDVKGTDRLMSRSQVAYWGVIGAAKQ